LWGIVIFAFGTGVGVVHKIAFFDADRLGRADRNAVVATGAFTVVDADSHDVLLKWVDSVSSNATLAIKGALTKLGHDVTPFHSVRACRIQTSRQHCRTNRASPNDFVT
jgi:hypothetical protein